MQVLITELPGHMALGHVHSKENMILYYNTILLYHMEAMS